MRVTTSAPHNPRPARHLPAMRLSLALAGLAMAAATPVMAATDDRTSLAPPAAGSNDPGGIRDPFEGWNRGVYGFNRSLDRAVVRPVAMGYRRALPKEAREGVHNVLANLGSPAILINDVLQVRPRPAGETAVRFALNTTVGMLGVFDVASQLGLYRHRADFGQTLGHYGVAPGPYLFLPVLGPSSVRDTLGLAINTAIDPVNNMRFEGALAARAGVISANAIDLRVALDKDLKDLDRSATDPYAATRSVWSQNRSAFIRGDQPVDVQSLPDFGPETGGASPAAPSPKPH